MSHADYIAGLTEDQLERLIVMSQQKLAALHDIPKKDYLVINDGWCNSAFYEMHDHQKALERFALEFEKQIVSGKSRELMITVTKYREDEMTEVLK